MNELTLNNFRLRDLRIGMRLAALALTLSAFVAFGLYISGSHSQWMGVSTIIAGIFLVAFLGLNFRFIPVAERKNNNLRRRAILLEMIEHRMGISWAIASTLAEERAIYRVEDPTVREGAFMHIHLRRIGSETEFAWRLSQADPRIAQLVWTSMNEMYVQVTLREDFAIRVHGLTLDELNMLDMVDFLPLWLDFGPVVPAIDQGFSQQAMKALLSGEGSATPTGKRWTRLRSRLPECLYPAFVQ